MDSRDLISLSVVGFQLVTTRPGPLPPWPSNTVYPCVKVKLHYFLGSLLTTSTNVFFYTYSNYSDLTREFLTTLPFKYNTYKMVLIFVS